MLSRATRRRWCELRRWSTPCRWWTNSSSLNNWTKEEHIPFKPRLLLLTFEFSLLLWSLVAFKFENGRHQMEMTAMHKSNNFQICPTEQISLPNSGKYDYILKSECVSSISFCLLGRQYCKSKTKQPSKSILYPTNLIYLLHIILTFYHNDFDDHYIVMHMLNF